MSETETENEREETHESIKDIDDDLQVQEISTTEEEMMIDIEKDRVQRSDHTQKKEERDLIQEKISEIEDEMIIKRKKMNEKLSNKTVLNKRVTKEMRKKNMF